MPADLRVLVPLAEGFEEIEAVTVIDVLRRAGITVVVAGLRPGPVRGAHGITVACDAELARVDAAGFAAIVLPGGMPGTTNLAADARVLAAVRTLHAAGKPVAAICAAPTVLARAGVLAGAEVTAYPAMQGDLAPARVLADQRVVVSGNLVTSQGPGTALEFALELVTRLVSRAKADALRADMIVA